MKRMYFAHPINTYGRPREKEAVDLIKRMFPDHEIVNPSDQVHLDMVAKLRENDPKANVMPYFKEVTASCDDAVVLPFGDGMWGAGVWAEAETIVKKGGSVWVIDPASLATVALVSKLSEALKLSIDDTRARIRNADGTEKEYV